jgi:hypothetical protein
MQPTLVVSCPAARFLLLLRDPMPTTGPLTVTLPGLPIPLDIFQSVAGRTIHVRKTVDGILLNLTQPLVLHNGRRERQ